MWGLPQISFDPVQFLGILTDCKDGNDGCDEECDVRKTLNLMAVPGFERSLPRTGPTRSRNCEGSD